MNVFIHFEFLVSKETVVLRRWERSKQKFGVMKRVDKTKFSLILTLTLPWICFIQNNDFKKDQILKE